MSSFLAYNIENDGEKSFEKLAQSIGTNIQKISQNVSSMTRMVNLLGTTQDNKDVRQQLQQIQQHTQQLVKDTNGDLKTLNIIPLPVSQYEQRQRKMQRERLTEEFTTTLNFFQSTQRKALKKESEQIKLTRAVTNSSPIGIAPPPSSSDPFEDDIHPNQLIELQDDSQFQVQLEEEKIKLSQLHEQEESIRSLERDISDVNQIYRDLGKLVHEQGEVIDSIEANIERSHVQVRDANSELLKASRVADKLRRRRFIWCVVLPLVIFLIVLYIYWQHN